MKTSKLLLCLALVAPAMPAAQAPPPSAPRPVLEERVEVLLVETVVRVSDRKGNPLPGLTREDVEVSEGGDPRRVGYFEPFLSQRTEVGIGDRAPVAALYDETGTAVASTEATVLPPRPARRIVIAFDVANSKIRSRRRWKEAAHEWVASSVTDADRVGVVVLRNVPEWIQPMTNNPALIRESLASLDLEGRASQRDRRTDVTQLFEAISACAEITETTGRQPVGGGINPLQPGGATRGASNELDCAFKVTEPWVAQWDAESRESIGALGMLTGALAAVPGRKEVLLFSEGIIPDAGSLATDTMLAVFGTDRMNYTAMGSALRRNALDEITQLHESARAAGVTYFTFDTRTGAERGYHDTGDLGRPMNLRSVGANPWIELYGATNATLSGLSEATGGDTYRGTDDLGQKVARAAESYYGTYALGFYRPADVSRPGKLRVKVNRKGSDVTYSQSTFRPPQPPRAAQIDLSIRNPEPSANGDQQWLPVVIDLKLADLPFRSADGTWGCQLAYFIQATRPDGTVVTEAFQDVTVAADENPKKRQEDTVYRQLVRLSLPTGPFRIHARVSDDRQVILAERVIDLTLARGAVRGGIAVGN